jgi:hypothetical protein
MLGYKQPTKDQFTRRGNTITHVPTGASRQYYPDGSGGPFNSGKCGSTLANGDEYTPGAVIRMMDSLRAEWSVNAG